MQTAALSSSVEELMAEMSRMRIELNQLKAQLQTQTPAILATKSPLPTTRRTVLRRLAGGMVAGLGIAGVALVNIQSTQAGFAPHKVAGLVILPPNGTVSQAVTGGPFGLVATSDTTANFTGLNSTGV